MVTTHPVVSPPGAPAPARRRAVRALAALTAGVVVTGGVVLFCVGFRAAAPIPAPIPAPMAATTAAPAVPVAPAARPMPSAARAADGTWPATGALFGGPADDPGDHFCTASVVASGSGDVIMTAAHCVADGDGTPARTGMSFAPGYRGGVAPDGYWTVTSAVVDPGWLTAGDPDDDVAFLTVTRPGSAPIQQVTGAYTIAFDDRATPGADGTAVAAVGYNTDDDDAITTTGTAATWSATQLRLDAPGLSDGTSGGPWLTGPDDTAIVGVTGGYEQGGDSSDVSYTAVLGPAVRALYDQAGGTA